ncbi:PSD1 and planctomycete cytochrome C domain-containing protein [Pirellulaceae bacterium SH449]
MAALFTSSHAASVHAFQPQQDFNEAAVATGNAADKSADRVEFNRDIRPILSDNCIFCHGPDNNKREADLRLDTQAGLIGETDLPGVVKPGRPDESELFRRIITTEEYERMPPAASHKSLTAEQVALIRRWIEQGAVYESHWAFLPLRRNESQSDASSSTNQVSIDSRINRVLQARGIKPSPKADPFTLMRRIHFDTIGLPPRDGDLDQGVVGDYIRDPSDAHYESVVDRLLNSPHFGERMAIWWLDLVRYADTVGYHGDQDMSMSPYRDYVIRSFNENKPFDQFTREQIAGDLVPEPSLTDQIASGYNRLGMMSAEGGVQPKEYLSKYIAERVRNVSGTWMAMTMGCSECHDHKFDPLSAKEFYQMEAFFADIDEVGLYPGNHDTGIWGPHVSVPTPEQSSELAQLQAGIEAIKKKLSTSTDELMQAQQSWEQSQTHWFPLEIQSIRSKNGAELKTLDDGSILASGDNPDTDSYIATIKIPASGLSAIRLEVLPDDSLPNKGPGRAGNGNFVLSEIVARTLREGSDPIVHDFAAAIASYEQTGAAGGNPYGKWAVAAAIDKDVKGAKWGWAIMEQAGKPNQAVFQFQNPVSQQFDAPNNESSEQEDIVKSVADGRLLEIELAQNLDNPKHTLGRFRLSGTSRSTESVSELMTPPEIASILPKPVDDRTADEREQIRKHFLALTPLLATERDELAKLTKQKEQLERSIPITLVTKPVKPRTVRVLARGNWMDETGEEVEPGFPAAISVPSFQKVSAGERLTRLDLANWITSPDNPLTARVTVNRLWKLFFGQGLSRSLDDFGAQGEPPLHPELLDYLAARFIESGWNVKELVREILLSDAYQRSSLPSEEAWQADPDNRWLARQGRFRLEAELIRDNALAVSGLLVTRIGGKSVKPYQPPGYWSYLNFPQREWENSRADQLYRRGLYTHWQRQYLHPSLMAFDAPSREECTADRPRSNTPLQSLVLLNDPTYVEAARVFATAILEKGGETDEQKISFAVERGLARAAIAEEIAVLASLLDQARTEYKNSPESASKLLQVGQYPLPAGKDTIELAAWTNVARTILNLHEVITRY